MSAPLAPWLQFSPSTFVGAAEAGRRAQQEDQRIGLERQSLMQSAAATAARLGMEKAQIDEAQKEAALRHEVQMKGLQQNFLQDQTKASVAKAYHDATMGLEKDKLTQAASLNAINWQNRMKIAEMKANAPQTETVTQRFKETDAVPADVSYPGRHIYNPVSWFFPGPGVTNTPAIPAQPAYNVTRKVPIGTSPAQSAAAAAQAQAPGQAPSGTDATTEGFMELGGKTKTMANETVINHALDVNKGDKKAARKWLEDYGYVIPPK